MTKRHLLKEDKLQVIISRLCTELIENHALFEESFFLGLQPRGIFLAARICQRLKEMYGIEPKLGQLDVTFFRDDFRQNANILRPNSTNINFIIENKRIILIDDVLYTGRTVRAALDAMIAFGRPKSVELLTLVDRVFKRDLPIDANYIGIKVNTVHAQRVLVEWKEQGIPEDAVWMTQEE